MIIFFFANLVPTLTSFDSPVTRPGYDEIIVFVRPVCGFVIHPVRGYESVLPRDNPIGILIE